MWFGGPHRTFSLVGSRLSAMEYQEAVNRLERLRRLRPKLGTETTAGMLSALGDPHERIECVQIAGSNGKGSTARFLESILAEAGLRVGLYTSPDLNGLRERIRVDGQPIPREAVTSFVEETASDILQRSVDGDAPTFFEAITAMALWHFDRATVDVAILEVGIGGRYDATSVVEPRAAAVTSVSLEHTDILGSTVEEIAADKASVAPANAPLVTGATGSALATIREQTAVVTVGGAVGDGGGTIDESGVASGTDEPVSTSDDSPAGTDHGRAVDVLARETGMASRTEATVAIDGPGWSVETESPLLGQHQAENAAIAATLARQLSEPSEEDLAAGIRNVHWPGRFEIVETDPLVVLDGAHNPAACETLAALLDRFDYEDLSIVFGAMRDKDHGAMLDALPAMDRTFVAEPTVDRAQDAETLAAIVQEEMQTDVTQGESVAAAVDDALTASSDADAVLITGSLYVVGEARDHWSRAPRIVDATTPARARTVYEEANVPARDRETLVDRTVTRSVRFHVRPGVARDLEREMAAIGGCAGVSGIEATDQHVAVVLSGTSAQFRELLARLEDCPAGEPGLAAQLRRTLGFEDAPSGGDRPWSDGTAVMGILNVTPDSFHDGGEYEAVDDAVARAREMIANGADVVDVGGESTRPGAEPVSTAVERERVLPVIERLADLETTVSIDTRKPAVAAAAIDAGADVVNDVTGLRDAAMRRVVAAEDVPAVLMHSVSAPVDPDRSIPADAVVDEVLDALTERVLQAERAGIDRSNLLLDPGLGFGKDAAGSFALLDRLDEFHALGTPVMIGHSRKSMFASVTEGEDDRLAPTVAASALAAERGVDLLRVHDVAPNAAAVRTATRTNDSR